jgi:hypothetical protein
VELGRAQVYDLERRLATCARRLAVALLEQVGAREGLAQAAALRAREQRQARHVDRHEPHCVVPFASLLMSLCVDREHQLLLSHARSRIFGGIAFVRGKGERFEQARDGAVSFSLNKVACASMGIRALEWKKKWGGGT